MRKMEINGYHVILHERRNKKEECHEQMLNEEFQNITVINFRKDPINIMEIMGLTKLMMMSTMVALTFI